MLLFLLLMLLRRNICHQVSNQADTLALLAIFIISRRCRRLITGEQFKTDPAETSYKNHFQTFN